MDPSLYSVVGIVFAVVIVGVGIGMSRSMAAKTKLPPLQPFGARSPNDAAKYYPLKEPAIAWEGGLAWDVNQAPSFAVAPPVDEMILTARLLNFCTRRSGHLALVFNFLVEAIESVEFNPSGVEPGVAPAEYGMLTIYTPSGRTCVVASAPFHDALRKAVERAQQG
jgi:hypothetical protein